MISDDLTHRYYEENARQVFDRTQRMEIDPAAYAPFLSHIPAGGSILDAGCGSGRDSHYFISHEYTVVAMDASQELCRLASAFIGQPVIHQTFEKMDFTACFDGIWASASLLHVPREDFQRVLLVHIGRALKPGGILYASFVYGQSETRRGNLLFNDYDEDAFQKVLETCPTLTLLQMWHAPDLPPVRPDRFWLHVLVQRLSE